MTIRADELERLQGLYPDVVRALKDAGYTLTVCHYPEGYSRYGKPVHTETVFRRVIEDLVHPPAFPPMIVNAVICDTTHVPEFDTVTVVFSTEFWMGQPINLYFEQVHPREFIFPEVAEDAFRRSAVIARINAEAYKRMEAAFQRSRSQKKNGHI